MRVVRSPKKSEVSPTLAEQSIVITYPPPNGVVVSFSGEHDLSTKRDTSTLLSELVDRYEVVVIDLSEATLLRERLDLVGVGLSHSLPFVIRGW